MDKETKECAFRMYLAVLPNMDKKTFKTFNEFWDDSQPKQVTLDTRSEEEIMEEILEIEKLFGRGGSQDGVV